jgi:hypothetical protein
MKSVGAFLVAALVIAGCSQSPAIVVKSSAEAIPGGWTKGASEDQSVTLGVPSGWRQGADRGMTPADMMPGGLDSGGTDPSGMPMGGDGGAGSEASQALGGMMANMEKEAAEEEKKAMEALKAKGIILQCVSTGKPTIGEERTRFYVKKESQGGNWSWDEADAKEAGSYVKKPTPTTVQLPIGTAHRMEESRQLIDGSTRTHVSYIIPNGKDLYLLRFVTVEQGNVVTSIDKEVAQSLRIKP